MKKTLEKLVILVIILAILSYSSISKATSINNLKNEQSSVNQQIDETKDDLEDIATEKSETLKQVETLISKISAHQTEIDELETKINDLKDQISEAEKQISADEEEYQKQRDLLDERIVATYKSGNTSYLDFLLSSSNLMDFISSYYLISQVADYDQKLMDEVTEHKEKIEKEKKDLETSKRELETNETTLLAKQQALKVAKKEKEAYVDKLSDEEKETEKKLQDLQDINRALDKKIKAAQKEIEAAKAKAAAEAAAKNNGGSSSGNSTPSSYGLIWPVLSRYSITTKWYYSWGGLHGASDFSGPGIYGTPIYAVADGYVVNSAWGVDGKYQGYGNCVFIAHFNGLYTMSAHMSSRAVSEGQTVSQGQIIGYVGSTGNSTGPHLHFEVRTGGGTYSERVNPIGYLPTK